MNQNSNFEEKKLFEKFEKNEIPVFRVSDMSSTLLDTIYQKNKYIL